MRKKPGKKKTPAQRGPPRKKRRTAVPQEVGGGGERPKTIGDLRRLLAQLGDPWQPDPRLSDEDLIPVFPTGGDDRGKPPGRMLRRGAVIEFLKKTPPSNPFLREVWKERGLLDESAKPRAPGKRRRRTADRG